MIQPPGTSVAGAVMAAARAAMKRKLARAKTLEGIEASSLFGGSSGLRGMANSHCFFGLSVLLLLGLGCGTFMEVGSFWPEDLIWNQNMLVRWYRKRSSGNQPCKVVSELLSSPQTCTCVDLILISIPSTLRTEPTGRLLPRSQTDRWVVHAQTYPNRTAKALRSELTLEPQSIEGWNKNVSYCRDSQDDCIFRDSLEGLTRLNI